MGRFMWVTWSKPVLPLLGLRLALLSAALFAPSAVHAVQGTITGRVIDGGTQAPLSAVQVHIPSLSLGGFTAGDGTFTLSNVPAGTYQIRAERLGYTTQNRDVTVVSGQAADVQFALTTAALALDAVIITGTPGGVQRRAIGNVVGRLDAQDLLESGPIGDLGSLLGRREPGVAQLGMRRGTGQGTTIRIRGASSLSLNNSPLIYVDGVRVESDQRAGGGFAQSATSRLDDFSPADIESIEIITGPAAATLYGTEASTGVIQIITRRGAAGAVTFDMSARVGTTWMPEAREWFGRKWIKRPNGDLEFVYLYDIESERMGMDYVTYGLNQYYTISARGGTDMFRFNASFNTDSEDGIFRGRPHPLSHERTGGRLNVDFLPRDNMSVQLSMGYTQRGNLHPEPSPSWGPITPMKFGMHPDYAPRNDGFFINRPTQVEHIYHETSTQRFTASAIFNYNPATWWAHRLTLGIDQANEARSDIAPRDIFAPNSPLGGLGLGRRTDWNDVLQNYTVDYANTVTLQVTDNIESATSVGVQFYQRTVDSNQLSGVVFAAPGLTTVGAAANRDAASTWIQNKSLGAFIEQRVGIGNNIFVTGAVRADDNSAFGTEFDAAIYPKISATWTLDEPFAAADWLDVLRLRGAYGAAGQQPDAFAAIRLYQPVTGPGGQPAITPQVIGNPDLAPERSRELEVGFDASFLGGRLDVEVTRYQRTTTDALVQRQLPRSRGFPGVQWVNAGQVSNWGNEISLNAQVLPRTAGRWFGYDLGVAFATMENRLDRIGIGDLTQLRIATGAYHFEGMALSQAAEWRLLSAEFDAAGRPTNVMCEGADGSAVPLGQCAIVPWGGPTDPTWQLNVRNDFQIGNNWQVTATVTGQGGFVGYDINHGCQLQTHCRSKRVAMANDNPLVMAAASQRREQADFYEGGDIRLEEVSLRYAIPGAWAERIGASRASLGVEMMNVMYLWRASKYTIWADENFTGLDKEDFRIMDPRVRGQGNFSGGGGAYMQWPSKMVSATMRVTF